MGADDQKVCNSKLVKTGNKPKDKIWNPTIIS